MINYTVTLQLNNLIWQSDWNSDEVGYEDRETVIGLYANWINEEEWNYYIDMDTMELLEFWKVENE